MGILEDLPTLILIALVVFWAFENVSCLMETRLDLDLLVSLWILRPLELLISVAIFPAALVLLIILIYVRIMEITWLTAHWIASVLNESAIMQAFVYFYTVFVVFLAITFGLASLVKSVQPIPK